MVHKLLFFFGVTLDDRVYSSIASEASLLPCDVIAPAVRRSSARCGSIRHGAAHGKPVT
jgi:hypothetical protein